MKWSVWPIPSSKAKLKVATWFVYKSNLGFRFLILRIGAEKRLLRTDLDCAHLELPG